MPTTPHIRALLVAIFGFGPVTESMAQESRYQQPPALADGWKTARAESLGVDSGRLAGLTASVRGWPDLGVHAILIERSGRLIYEEYFEAFGPAR
jgi:hypothetical protein